MKRGIWLIASLLLAVLSGPAGAQDTGAVTGLDLPRFVSIKGAKANARRGPSLDHKIDWVFVRRNLPVQVTAEHGHWRRVRDMDGEGGWVHYSLLSRSHTAIVTEAELPIHYSPRPDLKPRAIAQRGVIVSVDSCDDTWCKIRIGEDSGYAARDGLWGDLDH